MLSSIARGVASPRRLLVSSFTRGQPSMAAAARRCVRGFHATSTAMDLPYHIVVGMPSLSPTMESGSLAEWYVAEGDAISAGDAVAKIETDKATMDFEAQDDVYVAKILRTPSDGNDLPVGTPIMITVEEQGDVAAFEDYVHDTEEKAAAPSPAAAPEPSAEKEQPAAAAPSPSPPPPESPPQQPAKEEQKSAAAPAPEPAPAAPSAGDGRSVTIAWARPTSSASPLNKSMTKQQDEYMKLYGSTGQRSVTVVEE